MCVCVLLALHVLDPVGIAFWNTDPIPAKPLSSSGLSQFASFCRIQMGYKCNTIAVAKEQQVFLPPPGALQMADDDFESGFIY